MFRLATWLFTAAAVALHAVPANAEERVFPGTVNQVWAAARSALQSDGWKIASEDRVAGTMVSDIRDISFMDLGLYADGLRHRLRLAFRSLEPGRTAVDVTHDLFNEQRVLWDTARHPRSGGNKNVEVGVLDGIALFVPAPPRTAATPPDTPAPVAPGATTTPGSEAGHVPRVMYRVTGSVGSVEVTYRDRHGQHDRQTTASLPWEIWFDGPPPPAQLYVSAVAQGGATTQSVACEIVVDGAPRSQSVSVGAAAVAACSTALP